MNLNGLHSIFDSALRQGIGSGLAASFGEINSLRRHRIFLGSHSRFPNAKSVSDESFFDLASLTKILSTTLLCMSKVETGSLALDEDLQALLTHRSGLPAWKPFYEMMRARFGETLGRLPRPVRNEIFFGLVDEIQSEDKLRGKTVYSDLGFLHLERRLGEGFQSEVERLFSTVPGLKLHYREATGVPASDCEKYVMTEICPWRGPLQGEVHDDNAWSKGGVAGHAGLFGRAMDLELWMDALFAEKFVSLKTLNQFTQPFTDSDGVRRALGFDMPPLDGSGSTSFAFSNSSIGHLGFTGTSFWMDLDRGVYAILLTNRVHPARTDDRIRLLRKAFHRWVGEFLRR